MDKKIIIALFINLYILPVFLSPITGYAHQVAPNLNEKENIPLNAKDPNFTDIAAKGVKAVVSIRSIYKEKGTSPKQFETDIDKFFRDFLGRGYGSGQLQQAPAYGLGSGVIISENGYIVTNDHVIDQADSIEVTLEDNRSYIAKVIGVDKATDIALLKIEEKRLNFLEFGNSDNLKVGEWVIAVGNPGTLFSTVTKGIVSAIARSLSSSQRNNYGSSDGLHIDSYIQTDAPVNFGNSGGPLINMSGQLIGINTSILGNTFHGYAFAVPSNVVEKVILDLKNYGFVRHTVLGIKAFDLSAAFAKEKNINRVSGVYIADIEKNSVSDIAGLKTGDVIFKINNSPINKISELYLQLIKYKPNDSFNITVLRSNKERVLLVKLKGDHRGHISVKENGNIVICGATIEDISKKITNNLKIASGVYIKDIEDGPFKNAGIKNGWIIYKINNNKVTDVTSLRDLLATKDELIIVTCLDNKGQECNCLVDLRIKKNETRS